MFVFDNLGNLEKIIPVFQDSTSLKTLIFTVNNNGGLIFSNKIKDSLYICDTSAHLIRSIGGFKIGLNEFDDDPYNGISNFTTDYNNNIYVHDFSLGIKVFNSDGDSIRYINFADIKITHCHTFKEYVLIHKQIEFSFHIINSYVL